MKCCAFEKIKDPKKKAILDKISGIGFALFVIMLGLLWLLPEAMFPETTWLIGLGLIILGGNVARRANGIRSCHCGLVLGTLFLLAGILGLFGITLPIFPILLVIIGVGVVIGLVSKKKH